MVLKSAAGVGIQVRAFVAPELIGVPIVVVASATWQSPLPVNVHQVAKRLASLGHPVLFVESTGLRTPSPLASGHDLARILRRLRDLVRGVRDVGDGLYVLSPLALPGARSGWLRRLSLRALAWQVRWAARKLGMERPILWAFLPTATEMIPTLAPRLVVYHCVDHYAANPGVDAEWIGSLEVEMLDRADLVLATSSTLAERLRRQRHDVRLVENVADVDLFQRAAHEPLAEPATLARLAHPRAVYMGNLARYRIETDWIEALADQLPELQILLIGPTGLGETGSLSFEGLPNVHQLGPLAPADLPAHLRASDVALIPFRDNEHTRSSFPLKFWEYVAAGLPVVSRDLPSLRSTAGKLDGVWLVRDQQEFVSSVRAALAVVPWDRVRQSAVATGRGWETRMAELEQLLGEALHVAARADSPS